jgi:hypothetical protein
MQDDSDTSLLTLPCATPCRRLAMEAMHSLPCSQYQADTMNKNPAGSSHAQQPHTVGHVNKAPSGEMYENLLWLAG